MSEDRNTGTDKIELLKVDSISAGYDESLVLRESKLEVFD